MAVTTGLMTVAEFLALPEPRDGAVRELHEGELIEMSRPKPRHVFLQNRIADLLKAALGGGRFLVLVELSFRGSTNDNIWAADVGVVEAEAFLRQMDEDVYGDAPRIVIEVLSPSNTAHELLEREAWCLHHGAEEFWVVDPDANTLWVSNASGKRAVYGPGQEIPLDRWGGTTVAVNAIFAR